MKGLVQSLGLVMLPQIILRMEQLVKNASPASDERADMENRTWIRHLGRAAYWLNRRTSILCCFSGWCFIEVGLTCQALGD